jgi:hypothetical protein
MVFSFELGSCINAVMMQYQHRNGVGTLSSPTTEEDNIAHGNAMALGFYCQRLPIASCFLLVGGLVGVIRGAR